MGNTPVTRIWSTIMSIPQLDHRRKFVWRSKRVRLKQSLCWGTAGDGTLGTRESCRGSKTLQLGLVVIWITKNRRAQMIWTLFYKSTEKFWFKRVGELFCLYILWCYTNTHVHIWYTYIFTYVHSFQAMSFFKLKALGGQNATFTLLPFLLDKFNRDYPTQTTRIFGAQSFRKAFGVKNILYRLDPTISMIFLRFGMACWILLRNMYSSAGNLSRCENENWSQIQ